MSEDRHVLELSQEAYDDLVSIQHYTYEMYGEDQWYKYGQILDEAIAHILHYPYSGHKREDVPIGYLSWPVKEHILIYRIDGHIIYLVRVLHARMDFRFQFS